MDTEIRTPDLPENDPLTSNEFSDIWSKFLSSETKVEQAAAQQKVTAFKDWWTTLGAVTEPELKMTQDIVSFTREELAKKTGEKGPRVTLISPSELPFGLDNQALKLAASLLQDIAKNEPVSLDTIYAELHPSYRSAYSILMHARTRSVLSATSPDPELNGIPYPVREAFRKSAWNQLTGEPEEISKLAIKWAQVHGQKGIEGTQGLIQIVQGSSKS